jgi:hypothetical protein
MLLYDGRRLLGDNAHQIMYSINRVSAAIGAMTL